MKRIYNKIRYDVMSNFSGNVDLSEPILSRFDVLCILRDEVNEENDSDLV